MFGTDVDNFGIRKFEKENVDKAKGKIKGYVTRQQDPRVRGVGGAGAGDYGPPEHGRSTREMEMAGNAISERFWSLVEGTAVTVPYQREQLL